MGIVYYQNSWGFVLEYSLICAAAQQKIESYGLYISRKECRCKKNESSYFKLGCLIMEFYCILRRLVFMLLVLC